MTGQPDASAPPPPAWASAAERGSRLGLGFLVWLFRRFGDAPARLLLAPIAAYYCFFARSARRASREYLQRVWRTRREGARSPLRNTYHHLHSFADLILDRVCFWTGCYDQFEIEVHGGEQMREYVDRRQGFFLVGAHLGNFDVLRVLARDIDVDVNVLMYSANAARINQTMQALDPASNARVIDAAAGSVRSAFEVRRRIERGEAVAVLADRIQLGGRARIMRASFMGELAPFPQGPFLVPMLLGIPLLMSLAIKTGPRRYEVFIEKLADGDPVPAQDREKVTQERVAAFAARLEHYCARFPLQWCNFYDFWSETGDGRA